MPRGTCENCGQHDAFVYAIPLAFGRNRCLCAVPQPSTRERRELCSATPPGLVVCGNAHSAVSTARASSFGVRPSTSGARMQWSPAGV